MNIGLSFILPNSWGWHLAEIFENIDVEQFDWQILESNILQIEGNGLSSCDNWINGEAFKQMIHFESKYYTYFVKYHAYLKRTDGAEIRTLQEFLDSKCKLIVLIDDGVYVSIYTRDDSMIAQIEKNAFKYGFSEVLITTPENDQRTNIDIYYPCT